MTLSSEVAPWFPCPACRAPLTQVVQGVDAYVRGHAAPCVQCGKPFDWWTTVIDGVKEHFHFGQVMAMAGARTLVFSIDLPRDEAVEVNLTNHGVPEDAEVVHLLFTAGGSVLPILLHGNDVIRNPLGSKFWVYGRPLKHQPPSPSGPVTIMLTWFVRRQDDTVVRHLVEAARHYQAERFDAVVVPANIAAESSLGPVLLEFFTRYSGKKNVEDMLQDGATYSHQLNVLIHVAAGVLGLPRLPDPIRGVLNRLRKLRNDIAHEGTCKMQSRTEAAEHLAAAFFLVRYVHLLQAQCQTPTKPCMP